MNEPTKKDFRQLALELPHRPSFGKEDFLIAKCNLEAVKMVDSWPNWDFFAVCIYGSEGCGKTHLANVFSNRVSMLTNYPYKIPFIKAKNVKMENIYGLFAENHCLVVEDLEKNINQEAMFHLYNLYRNEGGNILFTSRTAPARLNFELKDLQSRLNIVPSIEIRDPDDDLLSSLIVKLFSDRQIMVSPEIINYMLNNMQRSFSFARKAVAEIDNISLARKRAVSIPIVKEALGNLHDDPQGDLFL